MLHPVFEAQVQRCDVSSRSGEADSLMLWLFSAVGSRRSQDPPKALGLSQRCPAPVACLNLSLLSERLRSH